MSSAAHCDCRLRLGEPLRVYMRRLDLPQIVVEH
ncbi:DUF2025 family protein [Pseudomonas sp. CDFA 550]|nr:DUF2025 family protein [Pseudomonas quasicaspiana]